MGTVRKVGEGNKDWADRTAKKARSCGFIPTVKLTSKVRYPTYGKTYGVYIKQDKKTKVHDYYKLLVEPWKIK